jgi:hypothetical protein
MPIVVVHGRRDAAGRHLQRPGGAGDDHAGGVGRVAHQPLLLVVDDEALAVDLELAVARVAHRAALHDLEEAVAVDGDVERVVGRRDVALRELLGDVGDRDADADGVAAADRVGVDVGELGARDLGADRAGVGDVVADHLEALARRVQTGKTLLETHGVFAFCGHGLAAAGKGSS